MKKEFFILTLPLIILQACIKDDIIDDFIADKLIINTPMDSIKIGTSVQYHATYFNNIGKIDSIQLDWKSSDTSVININNLGKVTAKNKGTVTITVSGLSSKNILLTDSDIVSVGDITTAQKLDKSGSLLQTRVGFI